MYPIRFIALNLALILGTAVAWAAPLTHETAPSLSDEELGHLRNFVWLANQDLDDWVGWAAADQKGMEAYRYQIAFMTYALSLQQYHSVPAYREVYRETIDRLITRMLQKPVWEFWEEVSQSSPQYDPDYEGPRPAVKDPVGEKNIMYSGHVIHMIALYESLYRDMRWSEPDALTFRWNSDLSYKYDYADLVEIIHNEMMTPRMEGTLDVGAMECEPNLVFPECNQHPTLAFMLFDRLRGTDYAAITKPALKSFFENTEMHNPKTTHTAAWYMIKQDKVLRVPMINSASADGWTGAFMHAWDPEYIESLYDRQRADYIRRDPKTGKVRLAPDPSKALGLAFFANLAVEVGDLETAGILFAYADEHYTPVHDNIGFRYLRDSANTEYPVSNTTDKLMALARSNRPGGLWKLHNEPWERPGLDAPILQKVDFPSLLVRQAIWDEESDSLLFSLEPSGKGAVATTFELAQLDASRDYELYRDDERLENGLHKVDETTVSVSLTIDGPSRFTLKAR